MNKSLFICIFNNRILNRLIFDQVRNHRCLLDDNNDEKRKVYKWSEVVTQPRVMAGNGYLEMLKVWFKKNDINNITEFDFYRILGNAIKTSHPNSFEVVDSMAEKGRSSRQANSWDVFDFAARVGRIDMIEWLAEHRPQDREGNTMYYHAVFGNHIHVLEYLKKEKKDIIEKDNVKLINVAAERGNLTIIKWLHENKVGRASHRAMDDACRKGYLNIVEYLHVNRTEGCSAIEAMEDASYNGHLEIVKWIHFNCSSEYVSYLVMDYAATKGHLLIVEWLHSVVNAICSGDALDGAAGNGHLEVVKYLHFNIEDISCSHRAMDDAAKNGFLDIVKFLHENRTEGGTRKILNYAAANGHVETVEWLVRNRSERGSHFAFQDAVYKGHLDMVKWLYQNQSVWLNKNEHFDFSHYAIQAKEYGHKDIERYLLLQLPPPILAKIYS
ncbi:hypothetical protein PPL_10424 [Heterostelium album PN500]|uniref:Ankyrin repeat protein n=1 Tax=Heterostelium pallidum (strain ATCC 26659 / Pp 5 / PN500) TaxID=670386 RepID=D3BR21_HETP5|nr:hypothetical protein PPL_10424 [Heterostelium album PN500]EFA75853.1 hypothetical protein PPL_10424 [Heterostelium album PN500]|eukprot:XP_020427987.1 hypothetical protein PPL_10424 [Heterostelium album PN500]